MKTIIKVEGFQTLFEPNTGSNKVVPTSAEVKDTSSVKVVPTSAEVKDTVIVKEEPTTQLIEEN